MHLKNPFGMRNGKIVMIRDITTAERGAKCNCICPLCQAHFIAKLGDIRQPHFCPRRETLRLSGGRDDGCLSIDV